MTSLLGLAALPTRVRPCVKLQPFLGDPFPRLRNRALIDGLAVSSVMHRPSTLCSLPLPLLEMIERAVSVRALERRSFLHSE